MITLDINNNNLTINGLNENDIWGLEVIDGNFMLSKYNGIAKSETESVEIITFPNLGETYGKIKLYLNEKPCYETIILNELQYITPKYFSVEPKEIIFNKKGETAIINVFSSNIDWYYDTSLDGISLSDDGETITVESNTNDSFKYDLTVFNKELGAYETVRLIQGSVDDLNSNTLIVSPTFVFVSNDNKTFNVHVTSLCDNSDNYEYKSNTNDIKVVKNGNLLKCEVTKDTFKNGTIEISNGCGDVKTVSIVYSEEKENEETYIYIVGVDGESLNKVTEYNFKFEDTNLHKFEISSNPIWKISGLIPENKLSMNKVGNILNASLNDYEALSSGGKITLKTRDDKHTAIINYTVASGLVTSNTKTFVLTNSNGSEISTEKNLIYNESKNSIIGIKAYDSNGNLLKWNTQSVEFDLLRYKNGSWNDIQTYSGGSENSLVYISIGHIPPTNENYLWLSATTNTINNYTKTDYTYNFIEYGGNGLTCKLNINYSKQGDCEETTSITYSNYYVEYVGDSVECNERAKKDNVIVTTTKTTKIINSFCVTTSTETEDVQLKNEDFELSYSPNTDNDTSSNRLVTCTVISKNNDEVIGEFIYTQKIGNCYTCETEYTSVEFDCSNIGKCDTNVYVTNVKAFGTYSCSNDSSGETSTTLSQDDYEVIVSPEITENTTSNERNFTVTVTSRTLNISGEKTITQEAGPCDIVTTRTEYQIQVLDASMGKCETTVSPTVQGSSRTVTSHTDGSADEYGDWSDWSNLNSSNYTLSYNPSIEKNETSEAKTYTVTVTGKGNYTGKSDTATVTQEAGPCTPSFTPYYEFGIGTTSEEALSGNREISYTYNANPSGDYLNLTTYSRYWTSDTEYTEPGLTASSNASWCTINGLKYNVPCNNTLSERTATITYTQSGSGYEAYIYVTQRAGECVLSANEEVILEMNNSEFAVSQTISVTSYIGCNWVPVDITTTGNGFEIDDSVVSNNATTNGYSIFPNKVITSSTEGEIVTLGTITFTQNSNLCNKSVSVIVKQKTKHRCNENTVYSSLHVLGANTIAACDTSASFIVTANGTYNDESCATSSTSVTLSSSDYTVKYGTSIGNYTLDNIPKNETPSYKSWYYKITTNSTYGNITYTSSFTQEAGPCSSVTTCWLCSNLSGGTTCVSSGITNTDVGSITTFGVYSYGEAPNVKSYNSNLMNAPTITYNTSNFNGNHYIVEFKPIKLGSDNIVLSNGDCEYTQMVTVKDSGSASNNQFTITGEFTGSFTSNASFSGYISINGTEVIYNVSNSSTSKTLNWPVGTDINGTATVSVIVDKISGGSCSPTVTSKKYIGSSGDIVDLDAGTATIKPTNGGVFIITVNDPC